jgi:hypothetical protein
MLIQQDLDEGRLVVAMPHSDLNAIGKAYYLIVPERKVESAALCVFQDWRGGEALEAGLAPC